ncbi:MAG TPA: DNA topoisomerase III [Alcaligenaceae bacterium]|nr:DNA topoisomerase III [Alcaligenaceae bacterium]
MTKTLIIAEKPSVALDISRALGGFTREGDYFESEKYVLSSSVGHLLSLIAPNDPVKGKWSFTHLPVIPPAFEINPSDKKAAERLKMLVRLIKRKDVSALINACDAGREGELIFRYIQQYAGQSKPVQRLWLQSMTQDAIRQAFANLRSDDSMKPLEAAARSRAEADWLVGINGTRAMTAFNSKDGGFFKTPVGRVQTPTLAIVAEREEKIRNFKPRDYWEVRATFVAAAGIYEGRWFDEKFVKHPTDAEQKDNRLWSEAAAKSIVAACRDQPGTVKEESKPKTEASPGLFDLTSLQREANGRFGFSAKTTLALAQSLYERYKALTYPRTDSRYLPEDYLNTVKETVAGLAEGQGVSKGVATHAATITKNGWIKPNKRIFDDKKVSDHFAIIPTLQVPKELGEAEAKIYDLVVKRFLAIFFPSAEYRMTTRTTTVQSHTFKTEGKVLVSPGWLAVYGREAQGEDATLVPVEPNEKVRTEDIETVGLATRPPARYNEATLLSAMEGAGKLVEDDELRQAMSQNGLGTPATRASIIEGLLNESYLRREGRDLVPTAKARQLMTLLNGLDVKELTSPELTGEWEHKLKQIEQGGLERTAFMREIAQMTQVIVKRAKEYDRDTVPGDYVTLTTPCPKCGSVVKENYRRYACTSCDFSIGKHPGGRTFEQSEVEQLLADRQIGPLQGFISKMGRPFAAILKLDQDSKLEFDFGQRDEESSEPVDFSGHVSLGACPKCGGQVFEHGMSYICEKSVGPERSCDFRSGKVILQQEISAEQMTKLLTQGKTDLLEGFVSSRTNRKFKAFLSRGADGKVGFEFEPRPEKPGGKTTARASKAATKTAAKTPSKTAVKKATKTVTKTAAKRATKTAVKKAVKKTARKTDDSDAV